MSNPFSLRAAVLTLGGAALTLLAACGGNSYQVVNVPNSLVVADLKGRGVLDVAIAAAQIDETGLSTRNGFLGVILNSTSTPGTSFSSAVDYTAANAPPTGIATGDVMGTGAHDIVIANNANGTLSLLTETSPTSGTYNSAKSIPVGGHPNQIILADMNNDGALDIVVADGSGYLKVLLQNPSSRGTFSSPVSFALPTENSVSNQGVSVAVADLDGDGYPDVVITSDQGQQSVNTAGSNGYVQVFYGTAAGAASTYSSASSFTFTAPVTLAANLASSCEPAQVRIFDLSASTTPQAKAVAAQLVAAEDSNTMIPMSNGVNVTGTNPLSILVACQGTIDANPTDSTYGEYITAGVLVINQTTATNTRNFDNGTVYADSETATYGGGLSLAVGDINGDGLPDVVLTSMAPSGYGDIYVMPQDTTTPGTFDTGLAYTGLGAPVRVQLADVNHDGYLDIVVADTTTAGVLLNQTGSSSTTAGTFGAEYQIGY